MGHSYSICTHGVLPAYCKEGSTSSIPGWGMGIRGGLFVKSLVIIERFSLHFGAHPLRNHKNSTTKFNAVLFVPELSQQNMN